MSIIGIIMPFKANSSNKIPKISCEACSVFYSAILMVLEIQANSHNALTWYEICLAWDSCNVTQESDEPHDHR